MVGKKLLTVLILFERPKTNVFRPSKNLDYESENAFTTKKLDDESPRTSDFSITLNCSSRRGKENSDWPDWLQELYNEFECLVNYAMLWAQNVGTQLFSTLCSDLYKGHINSKHFCFEFGKKNNLVEVMNICLNVNC